MSRAISARRERPSRRLALPRARLASVTGLLWACLVLARGLVPSLLLLVTVLSGGADKAHAQTVDLYKNVQDDFIDYVVVGDVVGQTTRRQRAMAFTTGDNAGGYTLSAVKVWVWYLNKTAGADPPIRGGMPKVSIYTNSSGSPGTSKYVLTTPTIPYYPPEDDYGYAAYDFTAPTGATLDANTTYFVVFEDAGTDGYWNIAMQHLTNSLETVASGWSAGTRYLTKDGTGAWGATGFLRKIYMELTGTIDAEADTTAPTLSTATVDGTSLVLTYNETLDTASTPATSDYSVSVNSGSGTAPSAVAVNGSTVTLTLGTAVTSGQSVTVTYVVPSSNPVQDSAGNDAAALTIETVTNNTNTAPTFADATATRSFDETVGDATVTTTADIGEPFTATDADADTLTYTLEGTDAGKFTFVSGASGGQLQTKVGESYDRETKASYEVIVKVDDSNGGTDTIAVTITVTNKEEQPQATAAPSVSSTMDSTTSLDVTWTAPNNTGRPAVTSYDVQYKKTSDTNWTDGPQDVSGTSTSIGSLTHSTEYEVQVRATNSDGDGPWSLPGTGSTNVPANNAPVFADDDTTRSFAETVREATVSTAADIGTPVTATDDDAADMLTYTLEGTDADKFTLVSGASGGQLRTKVGESYNHEDKASYDVIVKVDDSNGGTDTIAVTINVTNVPEFVSANVPTTGAFLEIVFDSQLSSVTSTIASALTVTADGETAALRDLTPISVHGTAVRLHMESLIRAGQTVTVSYTDPTSGNDTDAIQDQSGIDAPSFTDEPVTNDSTIQPGAPSPVTNLTVTVDTNNRFNLSWVAPVDNGGRTIEGYRIEWSADADLTGVSADWQDVSTNTNSQLTRHIHTPLPGQTRSFRVSAINSVGVGQASNVVTATARTADGTPSAPRDLTASATQRQIDLSWEPPGYEGVAGDAITGYKIEGSTDGGINWTELVADTGTTATTYAHMNLDYDTEWHYRVSALNSDGAGQTATVSATTLNRNTPTEPLNLRAVLSPTEITLTWDPPTDDGGDTVVGFVYQLSYGDFTEDWRLALLVHERSIYEHVVRGLHPGQTYTIRFRSYNVNGPGVSKEMTVTLPLTTDSPSGPLLAIPLADQTATVGVSFVYEIPEGTFTGGDRDPLTYAAAMSNGGELPEWLAFDPATRMFTGTPGPGDVGTVFMTVTANDGRAVASDEFALTVVAVSTSTLQAWTSRLGRTVADQVLDAVDARLAAARAPGFEARLAGQALSFDAAPEDAEALQARGEDGAEDRDALSGARTVPARDLFTGTSFALTEGSPGEGTVSAWGGGVISNFDGREGDLTLDGEVWNLMLGADFTRGRATAGLMLSHAQGRGGYRGASAGSIEAILTGLYPYGRYAVSERVSVWGAAGYGEGTLTVEPEEQAVLETDMDLAMVSVGARGVLLEAPAEGGAELAIKSDAMAVRTTSEAMSTGHLAAAEADVTRLRLGLEGSRSFRFDGGASLTPSVEIGMRHDGGDAETGAGIEIGGGLSWSDPRRGLSSEVRGRGLLSHEAEGFREQGFSGSLSWDPAPDTGRGPKFSMNQTLGGRASGGVDALFERNTLAGLAANDNGRDGDTLARRRFGMKLGYGLAALGGRFTWTPELGFGASATRRDYSLGWRLVRDPRPGDIGSLEFSFEARRQESANDDAEPGHGLGFRLTAGF